MLYDDIQETAQYIRNRTNDFKPEFGIILGTGLGKLTNSIELVAEIPYAELPHFPVSTVKGHAGKLVFGHLGGKPVVAMAGRFHHYEGYTMRQITFPVRVLNALGIRLLIISNAAGSVNENMEMGDIVFIRDHINMQPDNPLRGENDERLGVRFPDMMYAYNRDYNKKALQIAQEMGVRAHEGVYVANPGPNLETPAEYNYFHLIGGDLVGMSTVPEVLVAKHSELPVLVVSVVSNKCFPLDALRVTTHDDVIQAVQQTEPKLAQLVKRFIVEF